MIVITHIPKADEICSYILDQAVVNINECGQKTLYYYRNRPALVMTAMLVYCLLFQQPIALCHTPTLLQSSEIKSYRLGARLFKEPKMVIVLVFNFHIKNHPSLSVKFQHLGS